MNWQDYKCTSRNFIDEIGILKHQYVYVHKIQSGMVSEFRFLTKEEYDSFLIWKDNKNIWEDLHSRKVQFLGYFGYHEFKKL